MLRINREGELNGQPANPGSPEKWPFKRSVYVSVTWHCVFMPVCVFARFEVAYFVDDQLSPSTDAYGNDSSA